MGGIAELDRHAEEAQIVEGFGLGLEADLLEPQDVAAGAEQTLRDGQVDPRGRVVAGGDVAIDVVEAFAVEHGIGQELAVTHLVGVVRVALDAGCLDDIDDQIRGSVGPFVELEGELERAPLGLRGIEPGGDAAAQVMEGWVEHDPGASPTTAISVRPWRGITRSPA